ncbi:MAG: hypothetical protein MSH20_00635 [Lachnospiraceae bacterium]|nr:hypothetical protein [Lachnospiraceae bacterium]
MFLTEGMMHMAGIVYDARRVKIYEVMRTLCESVGLGGSWADDLWMEALADGALMEELVYFLEHGCLLDQMRIEGYSVVDLYVWQMDRYNLIADSGKNTASCSKDAMVLKALAAMADMKKRPAYYKKRLEEGPGMDRTI